MLDTIWRLLWISIAGQYLMALLAGDDVSVTRNVVEDSKHAKSASSPTRDFLTLPERTSKPRTHGLSHVLDNGLSLEETRHRLAAAGEHIDLWKFGWGTAYIDPALDAKLELLAASGVSACTGGTLLEIAWVQGQIPAFLDWAEQTGFACVEVSCGSVLMDRTTKDELIARARHRFVVLAEIGTKDPRADVSASQWRKDATADLAAGATWVVTEGRDSGTVGMFDPDGSVRTSLVDALVEAIDLPRLLFEAPQKSQQAWLIRHFGANVNLGNIDPSEAMAVEALRLGLRSDTLATGSRE